MSETDRMTIDERRKYLHKMRIRYWQAKNRKERSQLLDEMERVTELHRKSLLRLIHGELARKPRRKQRGCSYGVEVATAVRCIAQSLDYPCAERLQPNLVWLAQHLAQHGRLALQPDLLEKLARVSISTVRRLLAPVQQQKDRIAHRKPPRSPGRSLTQEILMRRISWDQPEPGHLEVDLVHHCGESATGQYVHSLQLVDVATGWSECVALLGRSYLVMQDGFQFLLERLPFPVRELHPDNGSEFLNAHLLRFFGQAVAQAELSRSRPYQKNDNRFVEENNFSLVRAYVGYGRLDTIAHTLLLNRLYQHLWLYHNFFQPVLRLQEKVLSPTPARRYKRIYDAAQTPFDRLVAKGGLSPEKELALRTLRESTDPIQLRQEIGGLIDRLFALPGAQEGFVEDVRLTLGWWKTAPSALLYSPSLPHLGCSQAVALPSGQAAKILSLSERSRIVG